MEPFRKVNGEWVGRPRGERKTPRKYIFCLAKTKAVVGEILVEHGTFLVVNAKLPCTADGI